MSYTPSSMSIYRYKLFSSVEILVFFYIQPLSALSAEYKMNKDFLNNTQNPVPYKLAINSIFKVNYRNDTGTALFDQLGNRQLLWRGMSMTKCVSVLMHGLQLTSVEAAVSDANTH
jgi:hypothetical protein